MSRLHEWLTPPGRDTDPREKLAWVRRMEIVGGIIALSFGIELWSAGWWHWLIIAGGLLGLSPWPGPQQILRRAEHHPEVLSHDPERGYRRARKFYVVWPEFRSSSGAPASTAELGCGGQSLSSAARHSATATVAGSEPAINFVLLGLGFGLGAWWTLKHLRRPHDSE